ncbi:MAG: DDE-type integrase/transposase/recombinase [Candidatus Erginobacter occultus]|nr:DDE-type integrase/transposase/recombinase [Candidatus Erginobacter occultus]
MKNDIFKLVRWFCSKLTFNDLASVVPVLQEVLSGSRKDIELKAPLDRPPHYRRFRVDPTLPLTQCPASVFEPPSADWRQLQQQHEQQFGKTISIVRRRTGSSAPPEKCRCQHCNAPVRYLYLNNGALGSQVLCKICGKTSPTDRKRRDCTARYWCPHCGNALFRWKEDGICTAFKCPNDNCSFYQRNLSELTAQERRMREAGNTSQFKLRYLFREYHFASQDLTAARPKNAPVDLNRIHNNLHTVGLCLSFSVSFGLSARMTAQALKRIFDIPISYQTVINYINASARYISDFVDANCPAPLGTCAADETYIKVEGDTHYTWFIISQIRRAICGYNVSDSRDIEPALALLSNCYGSPQSPKCESGDLVTDGLPSYDSAVVAYNVKARQSSGQSLLTKHTVIGLKNLDPESETYRVFKQLIERLNRTYKFHTRPRAGFKDFNGVVALTTLFVAFYNFMRPHGALKGNPPVPLDCLQHQTLYPRMWVEMLRQAA